MKAVILAGGLGTRISEETYLKPKPMIEIGGRPIIWHIMKIYSAYEINDFIICCGYKGYLIKEYFANYFLHNSDVTFDLSKNQMKIHNHSNESWRVTLVDTGEDTNTGGRLKRVSSFINSDDSFCLTYGDGVADIDIAASLKFHTKHGCLATVTAVQPPGRFGVLNKNGQIINGFTEKPKRGGGWINGGFFVLSPKVFQYIDSDSISWELEPMQKLAETGQLRAFEHNGFWQPMDTLRDKHHLENLWASGQAPWKKW